MPAERTTGEGLEPARLGTNSLSPYLPSFGAAEMTAGLKLLARI
jgi:hypothetical protein